MYQNLVLCRLPPYPLIFAGSFESRLLNGPLMFMLAGLEPVSGKAACCTYNRKTGPRPVGVTS